MTKSERGRPTKAHREQVRRESMSASVKRPSHAMHVTGEFPDRLRYDARLNADTLAALLRAPLGSKPTRGK